MKQLSKRTYNWIGLSLVGKGWRFIIQSTRISENGENCQVGGIEGKMKLWVCKGEERAIITWPMGTADEVVWNKYCVAMRMAFQ